MTHCASEKRPTPSLTKWTSTSSSTRYLSPPNTPFPTHTNEGMPFPRHLRTPISQFLLDNSHGPQGFVQHDHISPTSNARSHGRGRTRKAPFSTSSRSLASSHEPTHYEILDVPVTATPAEIKKCVSNPSHPTSLPRTQATATATAT